MKNLFNVTFMAISVLTFMMTHQILAQTCSPPCTSGNYCADVNGSSECLFNCPGGYPCWQGGTCCPGSDNPQGCCPAAYTCDGQGGCHLDKTGETIRAPSVKTDLN